MQGRWLAAPVCTGKGLRTGGTVTMPVLSGLRGDQLPRRGVEPQPEACKKTPATKGGRCQGRYERARCVAQWRMWTLAPPAAERRGRTLRWMLPSATRSTCGLGRHPRTYDSYCGEEQRTSLPLAEDAIRGGFLLFCRWTHIILP